MEPPLPPPPSLLSCRCCRSQGASQATYAAATIPAVHGASPLWAQPLFWPAVLTGAFPLLVLAVVRVTASVRRAPSLSSPRSVYGTYSSPGPAAGHFNGAGPRQWRGLQLRAFAGSQPRRHMALAAQRNGWILPQPTAEPPEEHAELRALPFHVRQNLRFFDPLEGVEGYHVGGVHTDLP